MHQLYDYVQSFTWTTSTSTYRHIGGLNIRYVGYPKQMTTDGGEYTLIAGERTRGDMA